MHLRRGERGANPREHRRGDPPQLLGGRERRIASVWRRCALTLREAMLPDEVLAQPGEKPLLERTRLLRRTALARGECGMEHALAEPVQRAASNAIPLERERTPGPTAQEIGEVEVRAGEQL